MAEAAAGGAAIPEVKHERTVYAASGGRKTFFSFVFLILLPFFASLPAMIYMRLKHGLFFDAVGLGIMATAFAILMFLIVIELLFSLRARVELGETSVKMTLPSGRGPTPMLRYKTYEVPYDQVQTVETRREIYGGSLVPVLLKGARLITKDEKSVPIGYVSEANVDPCFPYTEIAKKIAERARLPLIDRGNVRRSFRRKFFGIKGSRVNEVDAVDEAQITDLNRSHHNVVMGLVGALVVLIVIGIVDDFASETPIGQTASAAVSGQLAPTATLPAKAQKK
ncbi:hypothetical protein [Hyphomicrobium sp. LHD-15]|uniref:hypothetical protein n=1 Tax=Hyphomicrobium sp. LHD-15 TaxID=3072142 RepID=UPI00280DE94D|nr:hypothetical protein [Hyphomicrobium sp. LHD-15]MDQ8698464.1 hypothetical protein [Hyphomicrobium sp. LHD-15]